LAPKKVPSINTITLGGNQQTFHGALLMPAVCCRLSKELKTTFLARLLAEWLNAGGVAAKTSLASLSN
jgi:hypothetical protein